MDLAGTLLQGRFTSFIIIIYQLHILPSISCSSTCQRFCRSQALRVGRLTGFTGLTVCDMILLEVAKSWWTVFMKWWTYSDFVIQIMIDWQQEENNPHTMEQPTGAWTLSTLGPSIQSLTLPSASSTHVQMHHSSSIMSKCIKGCVKNPEINRCRNTNTSNHSEITLISLCANPEIPHSQTQTWENGVHSEV